MVASLVKDKKTKGELKSPRKDNSHCKMVTILNYSAPVNAEVPAGSAAAQGVAVTISWSPPTAQGTLLQFSACFGFFQEETHKFLLVMA